MEAQSKMWVCDLFDCWDCGFESHRGVDVCLFYVLRVLSGRGLCDGLITLPEESYRLWCVVVCVLGLWVRIPLGRGRGFLYVLRVLSGIGLCEGLTTLPEESYRLWCVVVCDLETSCMRRPWSALVSIATVAKKKK